MGERERCVASRRGERDGRSKKEVIKSDHVCVVGAWWQGAAAGPSPGSLGLSRRLSAPRRTGPDYRTAHLPRKKFSPISRNLNGE